VINTDVVFLNDTFDPKIVFKDGSQELSVNYGLRNGPRNHIR